MENENKKIKRERDELYVKYNELKRQMQMLSPRKGQRSSFHDNRNNNENETKVLVDNIAILVDVVKVALDAFGVREPEFFERDFNKT
jgi:hypothetical protein